MITLLRRVFGKSKDDGLVEVRARLENLKKIGGPEIEAHAHCNNNRSELAASEQAGCFYCCSVFDPDEIEDWVGDDRCALCPKCGIDSVIGTASGFPVADLHFLEKMRGIWF